jgi:hypothetical protein
MAKQPSYPVKELRSYVRESDNIVCYHPICVKPKEVFIEQARAIWGDRYDYTDSVYTNNKEPITIRCRKHDHYFTVAMAQNHLMKHNATGCPVCSYEQQYGEHFGTDWRKYLEPTPGQNRVRRIVHPHSSHYAPLSPEEKAARHAKTVEEQRIRSHQQACNDFRTRLEAKFGDHYTFKDDDYRGSCYAMTFRCKHHGDFTVEPRELITDRTDGRHSHRECPVCEGREVQKRMTADEFFQRMHQLYDATELDFLTSEYKGKFENVTAYCRKHGAITHPAKYWLEGKGCEYCNGKFYPADFLQMARKAQGQEYTYRGVNKIVSTASRVMVHCGNPNHKWHRMLVSLVLHGCKCCECAGRHQSIEKRKADLLERVKEKFGDGRFLIAIDEYTTTHNPITVTCLDHNYTYKIAPDILLNGAGGCPYCTASEGEAVIKGWLENHNIPHLWHAQIPNEDPTLPLQYVEPDFWLEHLNLYIEYHGQQHYEDVKYFYKGKKIRSFAVQQHRDRYLRDYCQRHGHRLLEIPYWDFQRIGEILTDELLNN